MVFDIPKAVIVRMVLVVHSLLVIWLATTMTQVKIYWLLTMAVFGMLVETLATMVFNKGQEWKWFCPCFFTYLCSTIPGIWILEVNRMQMYQETLLAINTTAIKTANALANIEGLDIPIGMETDTLVVIMEQLFLYLMILGRWILPRGEITRDELSQLLFVFIGIASDITELFALFEEDKVRQSTHLTYAILCVWTFSLLQFTFVLTSTHTPQLQIVMNDAEAVNEEQDDGGVVGCIKYIFTTEVWSICVNFLLQDGPFLSIRLYTMVAMKVLTYSIVFFTAKNALLVMLVTYRLTVLCCERRHQQSQVGNDSRQSRESLESNRSENSLAKTQNNHTLNSSFVDEIKA